MINEAQKYGKTMQRKRTLNTNKERNKGKIYKGRLRGEGQKQILLEVKKQDQINEVKKV